MYACRGRISYQVLESPGLWISDRCFCGAQWTMAGLTGCNPARHDRVWYTIGTDTILGFPYGLQKPILIIKAPILARTQRVRGLRKLVVSGRP